DDGAGLGNFLRVQRDGARANVERHHVGRNGASGLNYGNARVRRDLVGNHVVGRQQQFQIASRSVALDLASEVELVVFHQRFSHFASVGLEEGVGHGAANQ